MSTTAHTVSVGHAYLTSTYGSPAARRRAPSGCLGPPPLLVSNSSGSSSNSAARAGGSVRAHVSTRSLFHLYFALPYRARGSQKGFAPGETFAGVGGSRSRSRRHAWPSGCRRGADAREAGAVRGKSEGSPRWKKISICVLAAAPLRTGAGTPSHRVATTRSSPPCAGAADQRRHTRAHVDDGGLASHRTRESRWGGGERRGGACMEGAEGRL